MEEWKMKMELLSKLEYENVMCIYKIEQNHTGMVYIGSTTNLRERMNYHIKKLIENTHKNTKLQNSWNASNGNFHFDIVEVVNDETFLPFAQSYHIEKYRRINGVYNFSNPLEEEFLFKTRAKSKAKKEEKITDPKSQNEIIKNTLFSEFKYLFDALKLKIDDSQQVVFSKISDYIVSKTSLKEYDAKEIDNNIIRILKSYNLTALNFESPFYDRDILNKYGIYPYEKSIINKGLAKKITEDMNNTK